MLPDYSVEILGARMQTAVREHLEVCAECREELAALERVVVLVEEFGSRQPPPGLFNAVRNRIESGEVERERPAWWFWLQSAPARGLAMGMAMAAVAIGLLVPVGPRSVAPPLDLHTPAPGQVGVARGELASAIRQHAMSTARGPLTDRVAWEAMAQMMGLEQSEREEARKRETRLSEPKVKSE